VGQLAAEGEVYFNALIYFNPFSFDVQLGGSLTLLRNGNRAAGLGFKLRLRGPNTYKINGKVWVTICGVDVDFSINHSWGQPQSLPVETASAVAVLRLAIEQNPRYEPITTRNRAPGVSFAPTESAKQAIDPAGGVRFLQRAVPLDVSLEKIGEAQVTGPKRVDLKVFQNEQEITAQPATQDFVRGHFFELSEAERLRAPDFDELKAGFEVSGDKLAYDASKAIAETYDYEIILIGVEDDRTKPVVRGPVLTLPTQFADRWSHVNRLHVAATADNHFGVLRPATKVVLEKTRFVRTDTVSSVMSAAATARAAAMRNVEMSFTQMAAGISAPPAGATAVRAANLGIASYVLNATMTAGR